MNLNEIIKLHGEDPSFATWLEIIADSYVPATKTKLEPIPLEDLAKYHEKFKDLELYEPNALARLMFNKSYNGVKLKPALLEYFGLTEQEEFFGNGKKWQKSTPLPEIVELAPTPDIKSILLEGLHPRHFLETGKPNYPAIKLDLFRKFNKIYKVQNHKCIHPNH